MAWPVAHPPHPATRAHTGTVQRSSLEVSTKEFTVEQRKADWGVVTVIAPGIGVEVSNAEAKDHGSYWEFISGLLKEICKVDIGAQLVDEFNPENNKGFVTLNPSKIEGSNPKLYDALTLLLVPMPDKKALHTGSFEWRNAKGDWKWGDTSKRIPRIVFPDLPGMDASLTISKGPARVTSKGIVDHADFQKEIMPFDLVLFHELCHAYYFQAGFSPEFYDVPPLKSIPDSGNHVEELLVCGLGQGRGLEYCENHYRVQKGLSLRTTYTAVQVEDKSVSADAWKVKQFVHPASVLAAFKVEATFQRTKGTGRWKDLE